MRAGRATEAVAATTAASSGPPQMGQQAGQPQGQLGEHRTGQREHAEATSAPMQVDAATAPGQADKT
eukprot:8220962-Alexandrium_andersonii.AAC.1